MYFWPDLELTDYEKRFVSKYKTDKLPGVLRRTYKVLLNSSAFPAVPGFELVKTEGSIQISRRARIFALTFAGDVNKWRINISTASGEQFTPRFAGGSDPRPSSLTPGVLWNASATDLPGPSTTTLPEGVKQIAWNSLPMLIDPNWELSPNEQLIFRGTPDDIGRVLEIQAHAWEFPGMVIGAEGANACGPARAGAGPAIKK